MAAPEFEFLVAGAERQFAEAGKVQSLSFWAFKILVRARRQDYQNPPVFPRRHAGESENNYKVGNGFVDYCAWRRYRDLEWLRDHLVEEFPAVVIPPIPEKDSGDSTTDKVRDLVKGKENSRESAFQNPLVSLRIRRLQLFFTTLSKLTEIHGSEFLKAFICMEEVDWVTFKAEVAARGGGSGWDKVKAKGFGLFARVKNLTSGSKVKVFDEISGLGKMRKQQKDLGDALSVAQHQLGQTLRHSLGETMTPHQLDGINAQNGGKTLPHGLVFNGHMVCDAKHKSAGTVRHVDETGQWAWIDWGEDDKLDKVPVDSLLYPPSGIADPAVLAVHQHLTQMESFFAYAGRRPAAGELQTMQDLLWYEAHYCRCICEVIDHVEAKEQARVQATNDANKAKDPVKKSAYEQEAESLSAAFAFSTTKVTNDYASYIRPRQQKALEYLLPKLGPAMYGVLQEDEWEQRLASADAALPLLFDVPDQVLASERDQRHNEEVRQAQEPAAAASFTNTTYAPPAPAEKQPAPVPTYVPSPRAQSPVRPEPTPAPAAPAPAQQAASPQHVDPWATEEPTYGSTSRRDQPQQQAEKPTPAKKKESTFTYTPPDRSATPPSAPPPMEDDSPPPPPAPSSDVETTVAPDQDPLGGTTASLLGGTASSATFGVAPAAQEDDSYDGDAPPPLPPTGHDV